MITKNFNIWKKAFLTTDDVGTSGWTSISLPTMKDTSNVDASQMSLYVSTGNIKQFEILPNNALTWWTGRVNTQESGVSIWLGKDDTEETENDYTLNAFTTSEISSTSFTRARTLNGNNIVLNYTREFKNISGATITIKEIGFLKQLYITQTPSDAALILFDRRVLPAPYVTLEPNETKAFTMVYEF